MNETLKKLKLHYYFTYILLVLSAVAGFFLAQKIALTETDTLSVTTLGIILMLFSIPYSFFYYKNQVEKLKNQDADAQQQKIVRVIDIRLAIVCVPLIYNVIMYYLTANTSLIFAAGMSAIILIYIKPSEKIFWDDLTKEETEEKEDTNEENTEE